jgi:hypothetical protein
VFQFLLAFQGALLGRHQSKDDGPVLGNFPEWFKAAGAGIVVFQQEALEVRTLEHLGGNGVVVPTRVELALVVSPTHVQSKYNPRMVPNHRIV